MAVDEDVLDLVGVESGEVHVEPAGVEIDEQVAQERHVPGALDLVQREVERLRARLVEIDDDGRGGRVAEIAQHRQALVATDDALGPAVPDDRVDDAELLD